MPWLDDIEKILDDANVGTPGTDIFSTSRAAIPEGDGPYLVITPTSGSGVTWKQNQAAPSGEYPGAQIRVVAAEWAEAYAMARAAYNALVVIRNQSVNSTWYRKIIPLQGDPFDPGALDGKGRAIAIFNIVGDKAP